MRRALCLGLLFLGMMAAPLGAVEATTPYKLYVAPTPEPTPIPDGTKWFAFYKPRWALGLKGGAVLPLGDLATYNGSGGSAEADVIYQGTRTLGTEFFAGYSSQPYKVGGGASPLNNLSLGVKVLYEVMRVEALNAWVGAGAAYVMTTRTRQVLREPVVTPVEYDAVVQNVGGLALLFTFGTSYAFDRHWSLGADITLANIALAGGTADSVMMGLPMLGLRYDF